MVRRMDGRKLRAWLAFAVALAVIASCSILMVWWRGDFHRSKIVAESPSALPGSRLVIQRKIETPEPKLDIDGIWRLAAQHPSVMADHLPTWLGLMMREKQYADVEGLSLVAILKRPWWYPSISIFQEARVRAMLAEGQYTRALSEAKGYYNVAPLADTPTAVDLLAQAVAKTSGARAAEEFRADQMAGLAEAKGQGAASGENLLKSTKVDDSLLVHSIAMTRAGSQTSFGNQISQGNLLLLADRPAEAEQSFIKACEYAKEDWDLSNALEGIARGMRNQDGSLVRPRIFLQLLKTGEPTTAVGIALSPKLDKELLREAALGIELPKSNAVARGELSHPGDSAESVDLPMVEEPFDLRANDLPENDPVILSRLGTQGDLRLRRWMMRWEKLSLLGQQLNEQDRDALVSILAQSKLDTGLLLQVAEAFQGISHDKISSWVWLTSCARRNDPALADWLARWPEGLSAGKPPTASDRADLAGIIDRDTLSSRLLQQIGSLFNESGGDSKTTAVIYNVVVSRGHSELGRLRTGSSESAPILLAMKGCETLFWDRVEDGDDQYAKEIFVISTDIEKWAPPDDPTLGWTVGWAQIGRAECFYVWGNMNEGLAAIRAIDTEKLTGSQILAAAWIKGLIYQAAHLDVDAIQQVEICARDANFKYADLALRQLFGELVSAHRISEAKAARDEYVKRYGKCEYTHQMDLSLQSVGLENQLIQDAQ